MTVTIAPTIIGLPETSGQHDVALPPLLMPGDTEGVVGLTIVPQQQLWSQIPPQAYVRYAMSPPQVSSSFRVEHPNNCLYMLMSDLLYAFCFEVQCWMSYSPMGAQPLDLHNCSPFKHIFGRHLCILVMVIGPQQKSTKWLLYKLF